MESVTCTLVIGLFLKKLFKFNISTYNLTTLKYLVYIVTCDVGSKVKCKPTFYTFITAH